MRPTLSLTILLLILLAVPVVRWVALQDNGRVAEAATDVTAEDQSVDTAPPRVMLAAEVEPSQWAQSAAETADRIVELGAAGRIREAMDLANYAMALPRHPTTNDPYGRGHATMSLDRMIDILAAYEMWDEAVQFCTAPNAVNIGEAMVESKRLRLLGVAFANKRQLTFRSRILTEQLGETREQLDLREDIDSHHNEICVPEDVVEIDFAGNDAARKHITNSVTVIDAHLHAMRKDYSGAVEKMKQTDMSQLQQARLLAGSGDTDSAIAMLGQLAEESPFRAAVLTALAEIQWAADQRDAATVTLTELNELLVQFAVDSTLRKRLEPIVGETDLASTWHAAPETLESSEAGLTELQSTFPLGVVAPEFELPGVNDKTYSLESYRGKPVLVVFYLGRGCLHCSRQLKRLGPVAFEFEGLGIEIVGISSDSMETLADSFSKYRGRIPYPLAADGDLDVFKSYQLHRDGMEEPLHGTFLLDADGKVRWRDSGDEPFMDMEFLLRESKRLLLNSTSTGG